MLRHPALVAMLLAFAAAPALAGGEAVPAVATAKQDVDGDGKADVVTVEAGGQVTVATTGAKDTAWKAFATSGTVTAAEISIGGKDKTPFVAISATIDTGKGFVHEALVLQWQKGALAEVWRGDVGPIGRDGDYTMHVEATARGLLRHQSRAGFERCDGAAPQLFLEGWNKDAGKFSPIKRTVAIAGTPTTLTATRTAPESAPTRSAVYRAKAASTERGASDASALGAPTEIDDGDPATAWREDRGGDGKGEFFTYSARTRGARMAGLRIVPGDARSAKQMLAGNRVARLAVVTKDRAFWIEIPDDARTDELARTAWWVSFPEPVTADCVTVLLDGFHSGKGAAAGKGESVIAELMVLADVDVAAGGPDGKLIADVVAGGLDGDSAAKTLGRRGASSARAIEAALAAGEVPGDAEVRLWRVLAAIGDPDSAAALGAGLASAGLTAETIDELVASLAGLGEPGQRELAAAVGNARASEEARIAAAAQVDDGHRGELVAALGAGPRALRKTIATRLAGAGVAWLIGEASQAAADGGAEREADLLRALGLAALPAGDAERAEAIAHLSARAAEVTDYERRYRIVGALAPLPDRAATGAVDGMVSALGEDSSAAALRQVAAAGLAHSTGPDAAVVLAELAADGDPGVRIAALKALAEIGGDSLGGGGAWSKGVDRDAVDRVLINALAADAWPEVRHTATSALARACPRPGPTEALETAVDDDADETVRRDALSALVTCRAPGILDRLMAIARNSKATTPLREHAVSLLAVLGDPSVASTLVAELKRWRSAAVSEMSGLVLAQRAAVVLGQLGATVTDAAVRKTVVDALLDTAEDPYFPEIQASGAAGLGELGEHCTAEARKVLTGLARSEQAAVKIAAKRALGTCGGE